MFAQRSRYSTGGPASSSDPNELLRRIDQQTAMTFHWVRGGVIVVILLLVLIALGF